MQRTIPAYRNFINFTSTMSFKKLVNYLRLRCSYFMSVYFRRVRHSGMPVSISVEPTTSCNLRCPECPSGLRQFTRPEGKMSRDDFRSIIDQLKSRLMVLIIYFQGEPLLNPLFYDMVRYAVERRVYTATSTNGHQLDDNNARELVDSGLDKLIISMDGADQETYEKYRVGGSLDKVKEGVRNVVKWKKQRGSAKPYLVIQFLVFKANEHQIPAMQKLSKDLGADKLELKTAQVYNFENDTERIPENNKYARYTRNRQGLWQLKKASKNKCFRMWSAAVISWDGRVVPCCFDKDATHQLGQLETHSFKEIWKSQAYDEFRKQVFTNRNKIDICQNCTE